MELGLIQPDEPAVFCGAIQGFFDPQSSSRVNHLGFRGQTIKQFVGATRRSGWREVGMIVLLCTPSLAFDKLSCPSFVPASPVQPALPSPSRDLFPLGSSSQQKR